MGKKQAFILIIFVFMIVLLNNFFMKFFDIPVDFRTKFASRTNNTIVSSQQLVNLTWREIKDAYYDSSMNNQRWVRWKEHYRGKIRTDEDAKVAIATMLESLNDPYSNFMSKEEFAEQNIDIDSKVTGIGVNIASIDGKIYILGVVDGSPAQTAQLKIGDIILKVNGVDMSGKAISEVASAVRGPVNSFVEIVILRDNNKIIKKLKRKEIKVKTVKSLIDKDDKDLGYIQITTFIGSSTAKEFVEALEKTKNTKGLIIDLRGNPGGLLPNAVFISNMFIEGGNEIVSIIGRNGYRNRIKAQNTQINIKKPVVVLVDGGSASASEILSGALKDYNKAKILGTRTYGKGMVQQIVPLPNGTGINLTIAKYLTPKGIDINKKGIEPDIKVELTIDDMKSNNDRQLLAAKNELRKMIK
ncbi:S41 family peptidase [bacterium]|nr:S41 family peptidase [bacterium]